MPGVCELRRSRNAILESLSRMKKCSGNGLPRLTGDVKQKQSLRKVNDLARRTRWTGSNSC
jgi:hypothetical protein